MGGNEDNVRPRAGQPVNTRGLATATLIAVETRRAFQIDQAGRLYLQMQVITRVGDPIYPSKGSVIRGNSARFVM